jgi:predicted DNA-binding antitoxin AbrB/MazE fold protein
MTTTVDAIYEDGKLLLQKALSLPEKSRVRVTIESTDSEREAWLKLSEDHSAEPGTTLRTMSSMSCSRNDVILLPIPFTDLTSRKVRPAVVVGRIFFLFLFLLFSPTRIFHCNTGEKRV